MLKEDNVYSRNIVFVEKYIEKAVKSCPSVESTYELIMAMQRKILLCLADTSHHCISLLLKGA